MAPNEATRKSDIGIRAEQRNSGGFSFDQQINKTYSDIYMQGDLNQKEIGNVEEKSLYLRYMEDAQSRMDVETLENMVPKVKFLFEIIR